MTWLFVLKYQKQISTQQILSPGSQGGDSIRAASNLGWVIKTQKKVGGGAGIN